MNTHLARPAHPLRIAILGFTALGVIAGCSAVTEDRIGPPPGAEVERAAPPDDVTPSPGPAAAPGGLDGLDARCPDNTFPPCSPQVPCDGLDCPCPPGEAPGRDGCVDRDECAEGGHTCDPNAVCENTLAGYRCQCDAGFEGDGETCTDVDECAVTRDICPQPSTCTNTLGWFECICPLGFSFVDGACVDVDECATGEHTCVENATCSNTEGSYSCDCAPGYSPYVHRDGTACMNIDECAAGSHGCHHSAACVDTEGSYQCACDDALALIDGACVSPLDLSRHPTDVTPKLGSVHVADLDRDGRADVLAHVGDEILWFLSEGEGEYAPPQRRHVSMRAVIDAVVDVDDDGRLDLLFHTHRHVHLALGDGRGGFGADTQLVELEEGTITAVGAGDFLLDGQTDVIYADSLGGLHYLPRLDDDEFIPAIAVPNERGVINRITVTDLNGDEYVDLLLEVDDHTPEWRAGEFFGFFGESQPLPGPTRRAWPADMDGDGDQDLVLMGASDLTFLVRWLPNDGRGVFGESHRIFRRGLDADTASVADFDGDGDVDVVVVDRQGGIFMVNGGEGDFPEVGVLHPHLKDVRDLQTRPVAEGVAPEVLLFGGHDAPLRRLRGGLPNEGTPTHIGRGTQMLTVSRPQADGSVHFAATSMGTCILGRLVGGQVEVQARYGWGVVDLVAFVEGGNGGPDVITASRATGKITYHAREGARFHDPIELDSQVPGLSEVFGVFGAGNQVSVIATSSTEGGIYEWYGTRAWFPPVARYPVNLGPVDRVFAGVRDDARLYAIDSVAGRLVYGTRRAREPILLIGALPRIVSPQRIIEEEVIRGFTFAAADTVFRADIDVARAALTPLFEAPDTIRLVTPMGVNGDFAAMVEGDHGVRIFHRLDNGEYVSHLTRLVHARQIVALRAVGGVLIALRSTGDVDVLRHDHVCDG